MTQVIAAAVLLAVAAGGFVAGRTHAQFSYRQGYRFGYRQGYFDGDRASWLRRRRELQSSPGYAVQVPPAWREFNRPAFKTLGTTYASAAAFGAPQPGSHRVDRTAQHPAVHHPDATAEYPAVQHRDSSAEHRLVDSPWRVAERMAAGQGTPGETTSTQHLPALSVPAPSMCVDHPSGEVTEHPAGEVRSGEVTEHPHGEVMPGLIGPGGIRCGAAALTEQDLIDVT
jgi:hypothetical protein